MWSYWSPPPFFNSLFSQISDHLIIAELPAHILEAGAKAWRRWCRFPQARDMMSCIFYIGLWLFSIFPFSTSSAFHTFLVLFFIHSSILTSLAVYTSSLLSHPFFFLIWLPILFDTQFSTPFPFSVMLISFILLAFSSSSFIAFHVHLAVKVCHFLLSLSLLPFVPFE